MTRTIHLGFEIGTGEAVAVPLHHTVITGQTQMAGKTTTLEAMISRSGLRALTFVTKRGEGSFHTARRIGPYFREQADWQFVASILEASRGEKLKFERAWIIRASKGARTLADVQRNVRKLMDKAKGMSADVYLTLDAYLDAVVPQIAGVRWAAAVELEPGVNVMDLTDLNPEMQHLVIRSSIDWVLTKERDTVVVVPEAWKFLPQGRGTPVKLGAESFIRQAASLHNYLWLDSQDIAGVEKIILKSVPVWILGVQRESNEVKRTLAQIPAGIKKPKPDQIATLGLGQFFACHGTHVTKVYVQPSWAPDPQAREVARGELAVEDLLRLRPGGPRYTNMERTNRMADAFDLERPFPDARPPAWLDTVTPDPQPDEDLDMADLKPLHDKLDKLIDLITQQQQGNAFTVLAPGTAQLVPAAGPVAPAAAGDEEQLYQRFKARFLAEAPELLQVLVSRPEIVVKVERQVIDVDGGTLRGKLALLIKNGFFDSGATGYAAWKELNRLGSKPAKVSVYTELKDLARMGFLTNEGEGYTTAPGMKASIKEK
jgi:hypothetical protein